MSPIMELIKSASSGVAKTEDVGILTGKALPDLQRLVEWAKHAEHGYACSQDEEGCICGLSEIQSLLGE